MTPAEARTLAQTDPLPTLSARWGDITADTRKAVDQLETRLRELDQVTQQLAARGAVVATDLGPVGNAARSAYQAARTDDEAHAFSFPRGEAA